MNLVTLGNLRRFLFHLGCFFHAISKFGFGNVFSRTFSVFGSRGRSQGWLFLVCLCKKMSFLEKVGSSFLHTLKTFWLDFGGLGPSGGGRTTRKNSFQINIIFLHWKKGNPKRFL